MRRLFTSKEPRGLDDDPALYDLVMFALVMVIGTLILFAVLMPYFRIVDALSALRRKERTS